MLKEEDAHRLAGGRQSRKGLERAEKMTNCSLTTIMDEHSIPMNEKALFQHRRDFKVCSDER